MDFLFLDWHENQSFVTSSRWCSLHFIWSRPPLQLPSCSDILAESGNPIYKKIQAEPDLV